jgi:hypothetical protein
MTDEVFQSLKSKDHCKILKDVTLPQLHDFIKGLFEEMNAR